MSPALRRPRGAVGGAQGGWLRVSSVETAHPGQPSCGGVLRGDRPPSPGPPGFPSDSSLGSLCLLKAFKGPLKDL